MSLNDFRRLVGQTITAPELASADIYARTVAPRVLWYVLIIVSAFNGIYMVLAPDAGAMLGPLVNYPVAIALGHGGLTLLFAWVSLFVGQVFRAERLDFFRVLQGLVWLKIVNLIVQVVLMSVMYVLPQTVVALMSIGVLLYSLYILSVFYERCFEFDSVWMGFATYLVASLSVAMLIVIVLVVIGG